MIRHALHIYRPWIRDYVRTLADTPVMLHVVAIDDDVSPYGETGWTP